MAQLDVLILDDPDSWHARLVQAALAAREATCQRLNCADLGDQSVDIRPGEFRFHSGGSEWEVSSSTTVWYRRLGSAGVGGSDPDEAQLIRDEMPHVLIGGLIACGVRWVDEPFDVQRAERKVFQLSTASRMGIAVPHTIITNDSVTAARMSTAGRVVAKALSPGQGIAPYVDEVHSDDLCEFGGLPTLLQEFVARLMPTSVSSWSDHEHGHGGDRELPTRSTGGPKIRTDSVSNVRRPTPLSAKRST